MAKINTERINVKETTAELRNMLVGKSELWQEDACSALMDAIEVLERYRAIEDVVLRPDGMDEPGGITVMDLLDQDKYLQMSDAGWELLTYHTVEARDKED